MSKLYYSSLSIITKQIFFSAEKLRRNGMLLEAANMMQKAEIMLDSDLCLNPNNKTLLNLKSEYIKNQNMVLRSMIKGLAENKSKKNLKTNKT